jgi:putative PIN family toxin of toxin-antitoxin system
VRIVLDTDVVVAAMRSPRGASAELVRIASAGRLSLVMNVALALEYEATCRRLEHRMAAGLTEAEVGVFVDGLIALGEPVETHFIWRPQLRDPGDEMVLEAAVNGQAELLVTFNRRHFRDVPARFGIDAVLPKQALARVRG